MPQEHQAVCAALPDPGSTAYQAYRDGWQSRDLLERERTEQMWRIIRHLRRRNATAREALRQSREQQWRMRRLQDKSHAAQCIVLALAIVMAMIGWAAYWTTKPLTRETLRPINSIRVAVQQ